MQKAMGSYRTYSSLYKTATLAPELAVQDLPLGRNAALVSKFGVKDLPLGRAEHSGDYDAVKSGSPNFTLMESTLKFENFSHPIRVDQKRIKVTKGENITHSIP